MKLINEVEVLSQKPLFEIRSIWNDRFVIDYESVVGLRAENPR